MRVMIDAAYVFRASNGFRLQSREGELVFVDYEKLLVHLARVSGNPDRAHVSVYVTAYPSRDPSGFVRKLESLGAVVKVKHLGGRSGQGRDARDNWDVGIAVDLVAAVERGEREFLVVAGSGALAPALVHALAAGAKVRIAGFASSISAELLKHCEATILAAEALTL